MSATGTERAAGVGRGRRGAWPARAGWLALATAAVLSIAGLIGWAAREEAYATEHWRGQLQAMAEDRRTAIERWLLERRRDAARVASYPTTVYLAAGRHGPPYPFPREQGARAHWTRLLTANGDLERREQAWLVGTAPDQPVLAATVPDPPPADVLERVVQTGAEVVTMLSGSPPPQLVVGVPVTADGPAGSHPAAVLLLASDPNLGLFDLLRHEPVPTRSGESLLVERDGDDVVYLSPPRHAPPGLRRPIGAAGLAAAAALEGREAFGAFVDYRGRPVLAAVRPIRDTGWGLVVKIDRDEALRAARAASRRIAAAALGLLAALAGVGFGLWRQQAAAARIALVESEARAAVLAASARGAEAALRESESRFERLARNAPDVIYRHRLLPSPCTEYVSPAVEAILGYAPEAFYADPELIFRVVHPDDRRLVERAVRGEIRSGQDVLCRWVRPDGGTVWTEIRSVLVRDEQGALAALEGVARDVSERVRAERTLRRLQAAVEQSPVTVLITDTEGTIEYVNEAFTRHSGYSREEALGRNPRILKSGHHPPEFYAAIYETLARGAEWRGEILNRRKDGTLFWEYASLSPIVDESGRPSHYLAVKENISERKAAAEALRRSEEQLAQAQRLDSIGRLAGGVAHDFNNLLGVIIGHAELARAAAPADPVLGPRLEQVLGAAHRAGELTRQLLAFSRRQVLQPRVLDLNAEVAEMEKLLRRVIGEDVALVTRLAPGLGRVRADPGQIGQVLMNLAVNARDAMPEGGTLTIETRDVVLDDAFAREHGPLTPGAYVELRVRDDGVGMDAAVRERAFEPFFTTKAEGRGSGLGLATVYGIVKQSGGFIWIDSAPGRGTTFTIHLPRVEGEAARAETGSVAPVAGGAETVLVVEDQQDLRGLVCEMLEDAGYRVLSAPSGAAALTLAEGHPGVIELLVTDVVMPGMSGIELGRRLQEKRPGTRILLMSGYAGVGEREPEAAGSRLLEKPFTRSALLERVRESLAGRS